MDDSTQSAEELTEKLSETGQTLAIELGRPDFYMEWAIIAACILVAWMVASLILRNVRQRFERHPPSRIDREFILQPLSLLAPVLAIFYLGIARPMLEGAVWIGPVIQLTLAYVAARSVLLIMHARAMAWFIALLLMGGAVLNVTGFMPAITTSLDSVAFTVGTYKISLLNLTQGLIILVLVFWGAALMSRTLESYLRRSSRLSYNVRELTVKFFKIFFYAVAFLITMSAMGVDLTAFAIFGGALGVGIGLGLQKITSNFISGITLLLEKSIKIGDLIELDTVSGWVRQLNVRYTLLETLDGREVMIPNEEMVAARVTNWTYSNTRARVEIKVNVPYGADVRLAQRLLLEAATEHPKCMKNEETKCWMSEFNESAILFTLVFWVPDVRDGRLGPKSDVMFAILEKFKASGIETPYPQRVVRTLQPTA